MTHKYWTLEVDPFSAAKWCFQSVQSLHPQNGTLIWAKAISWLTQPGSGCFRHASPTACSGMKGHGGRRCEKRCKYQHSRLPRGSVATSMGHLGGFAIEDGSKKVSNMVLRHLALDAESFTVLCWFLAFIKTTPEGSSQFCGGFIFTATFRNIVQEAVVFFYSPPVNESPINSAHFLSYGSFASYMKYWTPSILFAISKYFEHIYFDKKWWTRWADPWLRRATMLRAGRWIGGHHSRVGEGELGIIPNALGKT